MAGLKEPGFRRNIAYRAFTVTQQRFCVSQPPAEQVFPEIYVHVFMEYFWNIKLVYIKFFRKYVKRNIFGKMFVTINLRESADQLKL